MLCSNIHNESADIVISRKEKSVTTNSIFKRLQTLQVDVQSDKVNSESYVRHEPQLVRSIFRDAGVIIFHGFPTIHFYQRSKDYIGRLTPYHPR